MGDVVWIAPDQLFDGQRLRAGAVAVRDGTVVDLAMHPPREALRIGGTLSPGFVDLQVNGGGGVLLNATPTRAAMQAIAAAHHGLGTVAVLPTVITDAAEVLTAAVEAALAARHDAGVLGLHIEGPHIAVARRGTHAAEHVRPMEPETLAHVARLRAAGVSVMITLAPEAVASQDIARLADLGAVVSIGHSDATAAEANAALAAGAQCFTHLFNAMSPMLNRSPGVTGAAINARAYAGVICDGHHVADDMVALALRARPEPDLTFFVSDAMPTVGGPDSFELYGKRLSLQGGRLVNDEGSLAGAHVTMAESVARAVRVLDRPAEEALRMAVTVPAKVIGRPDLARLDGRALRDLVVLDAGMGLIGPLDAALPVPV